MRDGLRRMDGRGELTRIRVTGSRGVYHVQHGDELPVMVRMERSSLICECARPHCRHIMSLRMCGFVEPNEPAEEVREAA